MLFSCFSLWIALAHDHPDLTDSRLVCYPPHSSMTRVPSLVPAFAPTVWSYRWWFSSTTEGVRVR